MLLARFDPSSFGDDTPTNVVRKGGVSGCVEPEVGGADVLRAAGDEVEDGLLGVRGISIHPNRKPPDSWAYPPRDSSFKGCPPGNISNGLSLFLVGLAEE